MRYLFLCYGPITNVVDVLNALGYLEDHRGFSDQDRKTRFQSRMRATSRLIDLIENCAVAPAMVSREEEEVLILRDKGGIDIPYPETDVSTKMREKLTSYNEFLAKH